jgi:hypothetical protein
MWLGSKRPLVRALRIVACMARLQCAGSTNAPRGALDDRYVSELPVGLPHPALVPPIGVGSLGLPAPPDPDVPLGPGLRVAYRRRQTEIPTPSWFYVEPAATPGPTIPATPVTPAPLGAPPKTPAPVTPAPWGAPPKTLAPDPWQTLSPGVPSLLPTTPAPFPPKTPAPAPTPAATPNGTPSPLVTPAPAYGSVVCAKDLQCFDNTFTCPQCCSTGESMRRLRLAAARKCAGERFGAARGWHGVAAGSECAAQETPRTVSLAG